MANAGRTCFVERLTHSLVTHLRIFVSNHWVLKIWHFYSDSPFNFFGISIFYKTYLRYFKDFFVISGNTSSFWSVVFPAHLRRGIDHFLNYTYWTTEWFCLVETMFHDLIRNFGTRTNCDVWTNVSRMTMICWLTWPLTAIALIISAYDPKAFLDWFWTLLGYSDQSCKAHLHDIRQATRLQGCISRFRSQSHRQQLTCHTLTAINHCEVDFTREL